MLAGNSNIRHPRGLGEYKIETTYTVLMMKYEMHEICMDTQGKVNVDAS